MGDMVLIRLDAKKGKITNKLGRSLNDLLIRKCGYWTLINPIVMNDKGKPVWENINGKYKMKRQLEKKLITHYQWVDQVYPAGLHNRVVAALKGRGLKIKLLDKRPLLEVNDDKVITTVDSFPLALRPYQTDAIARGLYQPLMTFHIATGGGKTVIFSAMAKASELRTLILVNRTDLLRQHYRQLQELCGEDQVGIIQGTRLQLNKQICVGMVQTIAAKSKAKTHKIHDYLDSIQYLIADECHHGQATTWKEIFSSCKNTIYKHGFSGSPWDFTSQNIELETVCGPILFKCTASDLIRSGYLARPIVTFHEYPGNDRKIQTTSQLPNIYKQTITNNQSRNKAIIRTVLDEYKKGHKLLLVVNWIAHGNYLARCLEEEHGISDIAYLHGQKDKGVREARRTDFERGKVKVMVVSQIWNEGIDIPSCDVLIKADALGGGDIYESEGVRNLIQQIGRVLRKPKPNNADDVDTSREHSVRVHDFVDRQNKYVSGWTDNRIKTCQMEKEFIVKFK